MAEGERRMLFDIRGRRKHVIRVVYAILAVLMGASLFLVVGPVNIGSLIGNESSTGSAAAIFDEQAERIERRLHASPEDPNLLLALTRARINAGNAKAEPNPETGEPSITGEAKAEFVKAEEAWDRYSKKVGDKVSPGVALLASRFFFTLAAGSRSYPELFEYLHKASAAGRQVAAARPTLNSLTTLAYFEYLAGNFAAADKLSKRAEGLATSPSEKKAVAKQADAARKKGKQIQKAAKAARKAEKGKGKEQLEHPLGGLAGETSLGAP